MSQICKIPAAHHLQNTTHCLLSHGDILHVFGSSHFPIFPEPISELAFSRCPMLLSHNPTIHQLSSVPSDNWQVTHITCTRTHKSTCTSTCTCFTKCRCPTPMCLVSGQVPQSPCKHTHIPAATFQLEK